MSLNVRVLYWCSVLQEEVQLEVEKVSAKDEAAKKPVVDTSESGVYGREVSYPFFVKTLITDIHEERGEKLAVLAGACLVLA